MNEKPIEQKERTNEEIAAEIEQRFRAMAREWARTYPPLLAWVAAGNKLPEVYR